MHQERVLTFSSALFLTNRDTSVPLIFLDSCGRATVCNLDSSATVRKNFSSAHTLPMSENDALLQQLDSFKTTLNTKSWKDDIKTRVTDLINLAVSQREHPDVIHVVVAYFSAFV